MRQQSSLTEQSCKKFKPGRETQFISHITHRGGKVIWSQHFSKSKITCIPRQLMVSKLIMLLKNNQWKLTWFTNLNVCLDLSSRIYLNTEAIVEHYQYKTAPEISDRKNLTEIIIHCRDRCHWPSHHGEEYDSCASNQAPLRVEQATYKASAHSSNI